MATDEPEVITLEDRINALEVELARLRETPGTLGWPNDPTVAQGFLGHRWQRRDAATPTDGLPPTYVSEAPADGYYYGRVNFTWQQVVEEAPDLTTRRSDSGWARASFGADVPWISLDDVLANYVEEAPIDPPAVPWVRGAGVTAGWHQLSDFLFPYAPLVSPAFTGAPTAPNPPNSDASTRLATTAFVMANIGGGIEDVPAPTGAYARMRVPDRPPEWIDFNALGVAGLASPAFTGNPTAPTQAAGNDSTRLATTQFVTRDALMKSGGQMDGPFITLPGTGPTSVGIGIGDNATGLYRSSGNVLVFSVGGDTPMQLTPQYVMMLKPMIANNQRIQSVGDATAADDALNRRVADARYFQPAVGGFITAPTQMLSAPTIDNDIATKIYVDQRRAPPVVHDFPANVSVTGNGQWQQIASVPVSIPRGGPSTIMAIVSCNLTDFPGGTIGLIGVRFVSGTPERIVWAYGVGAPSNLACGFTVTLTTDIVGSTLSVPIEVISISTGAAPPAFSIVGGGPTDASRSQVVIVDLGPATTAGETDAQSENEPSGAGGGEQRNAARPNRGRHARTPARAR